MCTVVARYNRTICHICHFGTSNIPYFTLETMMYDIISIIFVLVHFGQHLQHFRTFCQTRTIGVQAVYKIIDPLVVIVHSFISS